MSRASSLRGGRQGLQGRKVGARVSAGKRWRGAQCLWVVDGCLRTLSVCACVAVRDECAYDEDEWMVKLEKAQAQERCEKRVVLFACEATAESLVKLRVDTFASSPSSRRLSSKESHSLSLQFITLHVCSSTASFTLLLLCMHRMSLSGQLCRATGPLTRSLSSESKSQNLAEVNRARKPLMGASSKGT